MTIISQLKSKFKLTHFRITIFILIPIALVSLFFTINTYHYYRNYKKLLHNNCVSSLQFYANESEKDFQSIIHSASILAENENIISILKNESNPSDETLIKNVTNTLNNFTNTFDLVDSAFIVSPKNDFVFSDNKYTIKEYFGRLFSYENYNSDYWTRFKFFDSSAYRILSPTVVSRGATRQNIIPIVFREIGAVRFHNIVIINLKLNDIIANGLNYKYTENTQIHILNKYTGQIFSSNSQNSDVSILGTELYNSLISSNPTFDFNDPIHGKSFVISYSPTENLIGYTYFVSVPYSDIYKLEVPNLLFMLAILLICIFLTIYATSYSILKIISPIKQIASIFKYNVNSKSSGDIIEYIETSANELLNQNIDLAMALPFAQEKYLINYLNSTEYYIDEHAQEIIRDSLLFKFNFFSSVIIHLYPTNALYKTYNNVEYNNIQIGFYNIVKETFIEKYDAFFISSEKETLYILINLVSDTLRENIINTLKEIQLYLANDMDYVELYIGCGGIYEGLEGIKQSHNEALNSLKIIPKSKTQIVFEPVQKPNSGISYIFTNNDENTLFNFLVSYNIDGATELIQKSVNQNQNIDQRSLKQLYSQILHIIFRVMRIKSILYDEENKGDLVVISDILSLSTGEIKRKILNLLNSFSNNSYKFSSKIDSSNIIDYINLNFTESDLCLENIALIFNTKPNYISKLIKDHLGIGFHEYITNLRITKAKNLLSQTTKNVQEIYQEIGFSSKQTFFRAFKNNVGVTPSEYRNNKETR